MIRVLLLAGLSGILAVPTQNFRAGTEGVRVDVLVTEGGAPVPDLGAGDFELRDNGVVQHVGVVTRGDVPLSIVFALDTSASVAGPRLERLRSALTTALDAIGPDDRAALLTFSENLAMPAPFRDRGTGLMALLDGVTPGGATSLDDAAFAALLVKDDRPGRQLVLLLTDGRDTASWLPPDAVLASARRSDAVVYCIKVRDRAGAIAQPWLDMAARLPIIDTNTGETRTASFVERLAEETGGRVFDADSASSGQRLADALREFKSRYLLTYTPTGVDESGWHTIDVKVPRRNVRITARRGYQK